MVVLPVLSYQARTVTLGAAPRTTSAPLEVGVLGGGEDGDAESTVGESGEDGGVAGLEGDPRPLTYGGEAGVECGADAGPGRERDEGEASEVFERDGATVSEGVVLADDSDERHVDDDLDGA